MERLEEDGEAEVGLRLGGDCPGDHEDVGVAGVDELKSAAACSFLFIIADIVVGNLVASKVFLQLSVGGEEG